ncbi:MAG TPA: preprotein translocase subunit YajC [Acidimicrobiales bacterium]|nr:preprotein translocase subunit YajC [Acidimicrobiales bacterium]
MTATPALAHVVLAASSSKSTANPLVTFLPLIAIGLLAYFFFIRPQQRKAQAARQAQSAGIEVGDEVQTVGGVVGTVLEIHGDRYTVLTGALGDDGNLDGPQPTRIVFVRQAIARKIDRIEDIRIGGEQSHETAGYAEDVHGEDVDREDAPDTDDAQEDASSEHGGEAGEA